MAINYASLTSDVGEERWHFPDSMYRRYQEGRLVEERPFNADDAGWQAVIQALNAMDSASALMKLRTALLTNRTYLEKVNAGTATNADHIQQVPALTRQMVAVLLATVLETH